MNRNELIRELALKTGIEQHRVENIIHQYEEVIITHLQSGEDVHLHGFVTFLNKKHKEKYFFNPQTGEHQKVKSHDKLKVFVSSKLDRAVNGIIDKN